MFFFLIYINSFLCDIEPPNIRSDYTRTIANRECADNGNSDKWRGKYFCDEGYFAVGLKYWYEPQTWTDDTGGNDARLYCAPLYNWGTNWVNNNPIKSNSPNDHGDNSDIKWCKNGEFIKGFKTSNTGSDCSEGVTNINIKCQSGFRGEFTGNDILTRGGWDSYTSECNDGEYVCGQEIRYMDCCGAFTNDRCMTAVRLLCCS